MKYFSALMMFLSMLVVGSGCCTNTKIIAPGTNQESSSEIIKHIQESTVALVQGPKNNREPYCAGVWIEDKTILTAAHCVEGIGRAMFDIPSLNDYDPTGDIIMFVNHSDASEENVPQDKVWAGIVDKFDRTHDLATIQVLGETSPHQITKIIQEPINSGQTLHIMGHTVGMTWTYARGYVATIRKVDGPNEMVTKAVQVSAPVWLGNSGGGAFDSEGHLIGICSFVNTRAPNIAFFVHVEEILNFLGKK